MSITTPLPIVHAIDESDGRKNSIPKIKAPFRLTRMNQSGKPLLIWVWSRRGRRWKVDQELRFDVTPSKMALDKSGS